MVTSTSPSSSLILSSSFTSSSTGTVFSSLIGDLIQPPPGSSQFQSDRENGIQLRLNAGYSPNEAELAQLQKYGYEIIHDVATIEKIKLTFNEDLLQSEAIYASSSKEGLLLTPYLKTRLSGILFGPERALIGSEISHQDDSHQLSSIGGKAGFSITYQNAQRMFVDGNYAEASELLCHAMEKVNHQLDVIHYEKTGEDRTPYIQQLLEGFELLSKVYLKRRFYPQAAGILWYARFFAGVKASEPSDRWDPLIEQVEREFLTKADGVTVGIGGLAKATEDRQKLEALRKVTQQKLTQIEQTPLLPSEKTIAIRCLYQDINAEMKGYIATLVKDCEEGLAQVGKTPPCEYALVGLGSLAREEMTPFSDFEFAILVKNEGDVQYFRDLTILLHLKMINLGETIIRSLDIQGLDWISDEIIPRGLSFDSSIPSACKTPLGKQIGREGDYELIHTPEKMVQFQYFENDHLWLISRYHLPTIMSNVTYVTGSPGSQTLIESYESKLSDPSLIENRRIRARELLADDLQTFPPDIEDESSGKVHQVKKELYRFPNTMIDALADYYQLQSKSSWERVEELQKSGVFFPAAAQDLKELLTLSQELRLSVYFSHGKQKENVADIQENEAIISELYKRSLPFYEAMKQFYALMQANEDPTEALQQGRFCSDSFYIQGVIAYRMMKYLKAEELFFQETARTTDYLQHYAHIKEALGKYRDAKSFYEEAIGLALDPVLQACLYKKKGDVLQKLAQFQDDETGAKSAYTQAENILTSLLTERNGLLPSQSKSSTLSSSNYLPLTKEEEKKTVLLQKMLEGVYRAQTCLASEQARFDEVEKFLDFAIKLTDYRTQKLSVDPLCKIKIDLSLAENHELEARIIAENDDQDPLAGKKLSRAKLIFKAFYRRSDHPKVTECCNNSSVNILKNLELYKNIFGENHPRFAISYNDLGMELYDRAHYSRAILCLSRAMSLTKEFFSEKHPNMALNWNNIGVCLQELSEYQKARFAFSQSLTIYREIFGENHPRVSACYNHLGVNLMAQGDVNKALKCFKKSLEISKNVYGKCHPDTLTSLNFIGSILSKSNHQAALNQFEEVLRISNSIKQSNQVRNIKVESFKGIGSIQKKLGDFQKALSCYEEAYRIVKKCFIKNHPRIAHILYEKGLANQKLGNYDKALGCLQKVLALAKNSFVECKPFLAQIYNAIGTTLMAKRELDESLKNLKKGLELSEQIFEKGDPNLATCLSNIACNLKFQGRNAEAQEYLTRLHSRKLSRENGASDQNCLLNTKIRFMFSVMSKSLEAIKEVTRNEATKEKATKMSSSLSKAEVLLRYLEGEPLDSLSRETGVSASWIERRSQKFNQQADEQQLG